MEWERVGECGVILRDPRGAMGSELAARLGAALPPGVIEVIPAPKTLGLCIDPDTFQVESVLALLSADSGQLRKDPPVHAIPICFELGEDWEEVERQAGIPRSEAAQLLTEADFLCTAVGFCPGFPYLGPLPAQLAGVHRRTHPRTRVIPGSLGLSLGQAGIYPLERPGGWQLIGRTPLQIVDVQKGWFPIEPGDKVRFYRVTEAEFEARMGEKL